MARNKKLVALVSCALLVAIQIILSRFLSISTPIVKIGFDFVPMALAGILFGPWYGCAVGAMADFLGANLFPIGAYFPGFTLVAGLCGLTYGLLLHPREGVHWSRPVVMFRVVLAALVVTMPLQLGMDTVWLSMIMGKGYWALLPTRVLKCAIMIPVQYVAVSALYYFVATPSFRLAR